MTAKPTPTGTVAATAMRGLSAQLVPVPPPNKAFAFTTPAGTILSKPAAPVGPTAGRGYPRG